MMVSEKCVYFMKKGHTVLSTMFRSMLNSTSYGEIIGDRNTERICQTSAETRTKDSEIKSSHIPEYMLHTRSQRK